MINKEIKNFFKSKHFRKIFDKILPEYLEREIENKYYEFAQQLSSHMETFDPNVYKVDSLVKKNSKILHPIINYLEFIKDTLNKVKKYDEIVSVFKSKKKGYNNSDHDLLLEYFLDDLYDAYNNIGEKIEMYNNLELFLELFINRVVKKKKNKRLKTFYKKKLKEEFKITIYELDGVVIKNKEGLEDRIKHVYELKTGCKTDKVNLGVSQVFKGIFSKDVLMAYLNRKDVPINREDLIRTYPNIILNGISLKSNEDRELLAYLSKNYEEIAINGVYPLKFGINWGFLSYSKGLRKMWEFLKEERLI